MFRRQILRGLALFTGVVGVAASCSVPFSDVLAVHAERGAMFDRYVAIGNSITAGYQSGGIIDSTQKRSYAYLLAQSMGTRFAYPSLAGRGCAPLVVNFLLQSRPAGTSAATCDLRAAGTATDLLNNLGVPGAWSYDPNLQTSPTANALTTFFLGGKSQVQRARDVRPTFASIWIGNNDVLGPASTACTTASAACAVTFANITSLATYSATIDALVDSLKLSSPDLKGVLIGVVDVGNAPLYFAVTALTGTVKTAFDQIACGAGTASVTCVAGATTINANCTTSPGNKAKINTMLAFQIRTNAHPAIISCVQNVPVAPVGDVLVMDSVEQKTVSDAVTAYNAYLSTKATALGWAFYDPNVDLVALRTTGTVVRPVPLTTGAGAAAVFGAGTLATNLPFGTGMSLDGVHPSAAVHLIIANSIITAINAKYSVTLPAVF